MKCLLLYVYDTFSLMSLNSTPMPHNAYEQIDDVSKSVRPLNRQFTCIEPGTTTNKHDNESLNVNTMQNAIISHFQWQPSQTSFQPFQQAHLRMNATNGFAGCMCVSEFDWIGFMSHSTQLIYNELILTFHLFIFLLVGVLSICFLPTVLVPLTVRFNFFFCKIIIVSQLQCFRHTLVTML